MPNSPEQSVVFEISRQFSKLFQPEMVIETEANIPVSLSLLMQLRLLRNNEVNKKYASFTKRKGKEMKSLRNW